MDGEKLARQQRKAAVTRAINRIDRLIAEEDINAVKEKVGELKEVFARFETAHDSYHTLQENIDDEEASDKYFADVESNYTQAMLRFKKWLRDNASDFKSNDSDASNVKTEASSDIMQVQKNLFHMMSLSNAKPETFTGDPLEYHSFISNFDECVDKVMEDKRTKLQQLLLHTSGKAKQAIKPCTLMSGDTGYDEARKILKTRFGNDHVITNRLVDNVRGGKQVRSKDELQDLADELSHCYTILSQMDKLKEIESQQFIVSIINRLPTYMRSRWKDKGAALLESSGDYPDFKSVIDFISKGAKQANDPVFSAIRLNDRTDKTKVNVEDKSSKKAQFAFASKSEPHSFGSGKRFKCVLCGLEHKLFYCEEFKRLKPHERLKVVNEHKLCHNCLYNNHPTEKCRKESVCSVPGCGKRHTKFIHVSDTQSVDHVNASVNVGIDVYLPVVDVKVNDQIDTCALLDTASSGTFCSRSLVNALQIRGKTVSYNLNTLSVSNEQKNSQMVDLDLCSHDQNSHVKLHNVIVVDKIPISSRRTAQLECYSHLKGLSFTKCDDFVDLLIGQDHAELLIPLETRVGKSGEPFACRTVLGWTVNGPSQVGGQVSKRVTSHFICNSPLESQVQSLWSVENEGLVNDCLSYSVDDKQVIDLWNKEMKVVDGHFEIPIPWKDNVQLPNNLAVAQSRLQSLNVSLGKRGLKSRYNDEVVKLLDCSYAEVVPLWDVKKMIGVWYLPHHAVVSDKKPDKVRLVFDCASKFHGESLNDKCLQGPDLNNRLLNVILRFRQHAYAIQADIEAMYNQILIPPKDRDALRFLWYDVQGDIVHYRMTRHLFGGIWCSSSSAFALQHSLDLSEDVDLIVQDTVRRSFYVDDCLRSVQSRDDAILVIEQTRDVLRKGGFNLTKFIVNDPEILSQIPVDHRAKEAKELTSEMDSKVLGTKWNFESDMFSFSVKFDDNVPVTRRLMLSTVASIFDPLGLIIPVVVTGKILFQDVTRLKLDWDSVVPQDVLNRWLVWIHGLQHLKDFRIPRCIKPTRFDDGVLELHHFSDASEKALGCCSYLRCLNKFGEISTSLVISKGKVAPLKSLSIPRLELQAAVMAARMDDFLRSELDLDLGRSYFWVDSKIVLQYILNESRRFNVYVANRVGTIRQLTSPDQWHHISGLDNPADLITRGQDPQSLDVVSWFQGPKFLRTYKSEWEVENAVDLDLASDDPEVKKEPKLPSKVSLVVSVAEDPVNKLFDHYSSWYRLKRGVAWLLKFKLFLRNGRKLVESSNLKVKDIQEAESSIVKYVQLQCFGKEVGKLRKGLPVSKSSVIASLSPFLDDQGVLRVGGRIKHAPVEGVAKHPILVPHTHVIAQRIALESHNLAHLGVEWVVSSIRQTFWITKIRKVVKSVSHSCVTCRKLFAGPSVQKMADLPVERLCPDKPPFTFVGLDCFGPFKVKVGRSEVKRYGCVFTCLTTRAIHIEKLDSLDSDSFINCLRRFTSRRGFPSKFWSDNGTNMVGGLNEMRKDFKFRDEQTIQHFCTMYDIEWSFNPPSASHFGGIWERMIRTIRRVLLGLTGFNCRLSDEMLNTLFCEVECIVNGRPITKMSDDVNDVAPLTPNHLLLLKQNLALPPGKFDETDLYRRRWRCVQHLSNCFWQQWLKLYLPELQKRSKWFNQQGNIKIGDLILILDEGTPRGLWPMGVVTDCHVSSDGLVRSVKIKTKNTELVRPVTKVVQLEGSQ